MNKKWILFSYSIPAINAKARMRIWRRISATGAVQLKTGLQILPHRDDLLENVTWLIGEVTSLGGEALALQCARIEGMADEQIEQLFQAQVDQEFAQIQAEARELTTSPVQQQTPDQIKDRLSVLRKLRKRCDSLRERDFFPSGTAAKTLALLDSAEAQFRQPETENAPRPRFDRSAYQGRTWVTRAHPYVDRLGSFWLIRRFIDPQAAIRFLLPGETAAPDEIPFDINGVEFSHQGESITFEVMAQGFGLFASPVVRIGELVKAVDLQEGALPDDAALLKTLLDGLIVLSADDHQVLDRALLLFDALHTGLNKTTPDAPQ